MAKVLISIDDSLLRRADKAAKEKKLSRSGFISQLIAQELDGKKGPGASKQAREAMRRLEALFEANPTPAEDTTQVIREMRDSL
jgi:metal-responsive CopG/Arc/MetJ family transcriptional regulator